MKKIIFLALFLLPIIAKAELNIDFIRDKVIIEKDGTKIVVELDKNLLKNMDSDEIVRYVCQKTKQCRDF